MYQWQDWFSYEKLYLLLNVILQNIFIWNDPKLYIFWASLNCFPQLKSHFLEFIVRSIQFVLSTPPSGFLSWPCSKKRWEIKVCLNERKSFFRSLHRCLLVSMQQKIFLFMYLSSMLLGLSTKKIHWMPLYVLGSL